MPPAGFEPAIPARERLQTHALDCANNGLDYWGIKSSICRVIQEESAIIWDMIVCVILSKNVHMNMGPILDGYGVMTSWILE